MIYKLIMLFFLMVTLSCSRNMYVPEEEFCMQGRVDVLYPAKDVRGQDVLLVKTGDGKIAIFANDIRFMNLKQGQYAYIVVKLNFDEGTSISPVVLVVSNSPMKVR